MTAKRSKTPAEPRWLSSDELQTWSAIHMLLVTLPVALSSQLQSDSELSFLEYYILALLNDHPDHTMRMSTLAFLANSELSRLSHAMRRMEERGLVRRSPDPKDGRFTHAILTKKGRACVTKAAPGHVENVRHLIFDVLDEKEQHALRQALLKILSKLAPDWRPRS